MSNKIQLGLRSANVSPFATRLIVVAAIAGVVLIMPICVVAVPLVVITAAAASATATIMVIIIVVVAAAAVVAGYQAKVDVEVYLNIIAIKIIIEANNNGDNIDDG